MRLSGTSWLVPGSILDVIEIVSIYLILAATLGSVVHSAYNRNEYRESFGE
jgi:hypothetical protein